MDDNTDLRKDDPTKPGIAAEGPTARAGDDAAPDTPVGADPDDGTSEPAQKSHLNRRDYLRLGAAAAAVGASSLVGGAVASTERYGIRFDRVVNAVDDLGMDPNGNDPIDSTLQDTLADGDVLIEFPAGEYYFKTENTFGSPDNWGIRGLGSSPADVRFFTDDGEGRKFLSTNGGSGQLVENFTMDYSAAHDGSLGMNLRGDDQVRLQDVHYVGFNPTDQDGAVDNLVPMALDSDGTVVVDGMVRTGPTDIVSHGHLDGNSNEGSVWLGDRHVGTLIFRNCHFANTGTNAVYASRTPGTVHYDSCLFENNNQTSIRIGGGAGKQNTIRNCTFLVDTDNAHPDNGGDFINPHGIVCETNEVEAGQILVENSEFMYKSGPDRGRNIFIDGNAGPIEIRNTRIRSEVSASEALYARTEARWWEEAADQRIDIVDSQFSGAGELEVNGGRSAVMDGGCLSCPVSGVTVGDNVSRDSCKIPDTDAPAESTETVDETTDTTTETLENQITITGNGTKTNYEFAVSGSLQAGDDIEKWDELTESSVNGWITTNGASDTYTYSEALGSVTFLEGGTDVSVNGYPVDHATLSSDSAYPNTLQIVPNGTSSNYVASVSGEIVDHPGLGTALSQYDTVDGGTIDAWVTDEMDGIQFSGALESFEFVEGGTTVYLNGSQIDPANYDGSTQTESTLVVTTDEASSVQSTSAELNGTVSDLGGANSAEAGFEIRPVGGSWSETGTQKLSDAESFSQSVSGLSSGTDYEYRSTVTASDDDSTTGGVKSFTAVEESTDSAPTISRFNVSEAGRKDPHAEITVTWDVADVDGDLESVSLEIADDSGTTLRSTSWSLNGTSRASDTDEYWFKKGGGVDYQVSIRVTDVAGNSVSKQSVVSS